MTLHDEWLFTATARTRSAASAGSRAAASAPTWTYPALRVDGTAFNRRRKAELYFGARLHVVAPSRGCSSAPAARSSRLRSPPRAIPNGVDLEMFSPGSKQQARAGARATGSAYVVVYAAQGARTNPYKDFSTLRAALGRLAVPAVAIALGEGSAAERVGSVDLRSRPFVEPLEVVTHLRAADLYALATRADNHPLTVLEALACGTPVVASRVGGIPEQVHEQTGVLVEPGDPGALAAAIGAPWPTRNDVPA